jgi:LacI family transcriptional regulator, gluconate utilization system Gnt-I transcriptional repressor
MQDVARTAGVSLVTVSRVVNQPEKVAPATLQLVRDAIRQLRFVPNLTAGSLASRRSRIIAVIVPTIANSIFADTVLGLSQHLEPAGYQLLLGQSNYDLDEEARLVETFLGRRVDGLVLTGIDHVKSLRARLHAVAIPVIETWDMTPRPIDQLVGFSNLEAGAAAARYLIQKGHQYLGYIGGTEARSARRLEGFRLAARLAGLPDITAVDLSVPSVIRDAGQALIELRSQQPRLQAIFCANDMLAAGVLFECQRQGWKVPGQLAILGFADLPIAAATEPALSSVQIFSREIGARAARMLLDRLNRVAVPAMCEDSLDLGFKIVERGST